MNFQLEWPPEVKDDYDVLCQAKSDRGLIRAVTAALEFALQYDPYSSGQWLHEGLWCIELRPLRLLYEIDGPKRTVKIVAVRRVQ